MEVTLLVNGFLAVTLLILIAFFLALMVLAFRFYVRLRREVEHALEKRKTLAFLMHMELFSLVDWKMLMPESDKATEESEAERFRLWRYN